MTHLKIDLANCYGIRALEYDFDFTADREYAIYAPNGAMRSSLARTLQDHSEGRVSRDRVYTSRETKRLIIDENGLETAPEHIFVVESYNESYRSDRMSVLLADQSLRDRYDNVRALIDEKMGALERALVSASGLKKDAAAKLATDVAEDPKEFMTALDRLAAEVERGAYSELSDIRYDRIFSEKVESQILNSDVQKSLSDYMATYDQLIGNSAFFKRGVFNHNNASDIAKSLKANGFFEASHSVYVNNKDIRDEIATVEDLESYIDKEKQSILGDKALVKAFERIDKSLSKNTEVKEFRDYLAANDKLIPELVSPRRLKQRLWAAYLTANIQAYRELRETYEAGRAELERIVEEARAQATEWAKVIDEFNERFSVPFVVTVENQQDVILRREAPSIRFRFHDTDSDDVPILESDLRQVLSGGEKRALYLLNIIFEVIARREAAVPTVFVLDDIADSFDYKNKYAIVEYLQDISEIPFFYQIILTHNFDFFRTVGRRLGIDRTHNLHTVKSADAISFIEEKYQNNPFDHWRKNAAKAGCDDFVISLVPFARNIAEYTNRRAVEEELTSFLHVKENSSQLTIDDLQRLLQSVIEYPDDFAIPGGERLFFDVLTARAEAICQLQDEEIELEHKVVLAIAVRIAAEQYMISRIDDAEFVQNIKKNQTAQLFLQFRQEHPDAEELAVLKQVNLMTPENIHLNSFMFEPILDMSNHHLRRLFRRAKSLDNPGGGAA